MNEEIFKKAIDAIQNQFKELGVGIDYSKNEDITTIAILQGEMAENVIKALDKQIAKKLTHEATLRHHETCPNCKNVISDIDKQLGGKILHCIFCGQRLEREE